MVDELGLVITSHWNFDIARKRLFETLESFAPQIPFYLVIGGAPEAHQTVQSLYGSKYPCYTSYVTHNSFEYTPLIELVDQIPALPDHLLCLQDTMEVGPNTIERAKQVNPDVWATAAFGGQCNLVTYRYDYLLARHGDIKAMQNITKHQSVEYEGLLWRAAEKRDHYENALCVEDWHNYYPYSTGTPRMKEYYTALDVIKWKANHARSMGRFVTTL